MAYFIHIDDSTFGPLGRRLGPYETRKEADAQAAVEQQQGKAVTGIHPGKESDRRLAGEES